MPPRLLAGQIGKPHGLGGEVYVLRISDDSRRFEAGAHLLDEEGGHLVVERARPHRNRLLVKFEGIDDRESAKGLRGPLFAPQGDIRELDEDEFWEHELIGASVVDRAGAKLGEVTALEIAPGQDRLVVATPRGERYVPVVREIVVDLDVPGGRVTIEAPEGLLD